MSPASAMSARSPATLTLEPSRRASSTMRRASMRAESGSSSRNRGRVARDHPDRRTGRIGYRVRPESMALTVTSVPSPARVVSRDALPASSRSATGTGRQGSPSAGAAGPPTGRTGTSSVERSAWNLQPSARASGQTIGHEVVDSATPDPVAGQERVGRVVQRTSRVPSRTPRSPGAPRMADPECHPGGAAIRPHVAQPRDTSPTRPPSGMASRTTGRAQDLRGARRARGHRRRPNARRPLPGRPAARARSRRSRTGTTRRRHAHGLAGPHSTVPGVPADPTTSVPSARGPRSIGRDPRLTASLPRRPTVPARARSPAPAARPPGGRRGIAARPAARVRGPGASGPTSAARAPGSRCPGPAGPRADSRAPTRPTTPTVGTDSPASSRGIAFEYPSCQPPTASTGHAMRRSPRSPTVPPVGVALLVAQPLHDGGRSAASAIRSRHRSRQPARVTSGSGGRAIQHRNVAPQSSMSVSSAPPM